MQPPADEPIDELGKLVITRHRLVDDRQVIEFGLWICGPHIGLVRQSGLKLFLGLQADEGRDPKLDELNAPPILMEGRLPVADKDKFGHEPI